MNTYMVEVNAKFLVKLQIEGSACAAEHYFLDGFKHCWGANAYDEAGMKTECFRGAILTSEIVSLTELQSLLESVETVESGVKELEREANALSERLAEIQAQYDEVKVQYLKKNTELQQKRNELAEASAWVNYKKA